METPRNARERVWECVWVQFEKFWSRLGTQRARRRRGRGGGVGGRRVVVWGACASILALGRSKVCYT